MYSASLVIDINNLETLCILLNSFFKLHSENRMILMQCFIVNAWHHNAAKLVARVRNLCDLSSLGSARVKHTDA